MSADPFDILGVSRTATDHEIAAAYRSLARQFHPDAHPEATADEKTVYETAMARINEAYGAIRNRDDRERRLRDERTGRFGRPGTGPGAGARSTSPHRPPGPDECVLCGCAPAQVFSFVHQIGMIISSQRGVTEASLCRLCALAVGRSQQNRTLVTGWWGLLAFFTNFAVVFANAGQLRQAHRLGMPRPVANVVGRTPGPMHPGRPVHRRAGLYVAAVIVGFVAFVGIGAARNQSRPTATDRSCVKTAVRSGEVGFVATSCSGSHYGKIVEVANSIAGCPPATDDTGIAGGRVYCIDSDR